MRTANLTGSISRNAGGLFESVRRLVQSLAQTGLDVRVFGNADEFTAKDISAWSPVQVSAFPPTWPEQFGYSPSFLEELRDFCPDITHTHGIWMYPSVATNRYCRRSGSPYVISAHGMLDPWAVRNSRWKKVIAYWLYEGTHLRGASCLRALCESEARSIRRLGLKNPIAIIPNGINLPDFKGQKTEDRGQRAEGGYQKSDVNPAVGPPSSVLHPLKGEGRKVLLYLGRIHPKKGLLNLLRAWANVARPQSSDFCPLPSGWTLAIAGWDQGEHEAELKRRATELGIAWQDVRGQKTEDVGRRKEVAAQSSAISRPSSLVFLGPQFGVDKEACYRDCDAFILPSFSEGLPMVVLEAWAHGKPVVMTPECNLPEGFSANAAIRIETDVESIAAGLRALLAAPRSSLLALGQNGYRLAAGKFAWPTIAGEMKQMYEWVLGGGAKPPCVVEF